MGLPGVMFHPYKWGYGCPTYKYLQQITRVNWSLFQVMPRKKTQFERVFKRLALDPPKTHGKNEGSKF